MQSLTSSPAFFHTDAGPTVADLSSANGDYIARPGGHPATDDELSIRDLADDRQAVLAMSGDNWPDDAAAALAEMVDDQAIAIADTLAVDELQAAYRGAREETGLCGSVLLRRAVDFGSTSAEDPAARRLTYLCTIIGDAGSYTGMGDSAAEAVADALKQLDAARLTAIPTGGYRVAGVGTVMAAPYRSDAEARGFARRIALDPEFVCAVMAFGGPGVVDHRQPLLPLAPAAA